jgi:prepilin-type N-terminal cleavage/methylation domain-containing protein
VSFSFLKKQSGFNLVEMAVVLSIIGLILGGVYIAASRSTERAHGTRFEQQFVETVQNTRSYYSLYASVPSSDVTATLIAANALPSDTFNNSASTVAYQAFGNNFNIVGGGSSFTLNFVNLQRNACQAIVRIAAAKRQSMNISSITTPSGTILSAATVFDPTQLPNLCVGTAGALTVSVVLGLRG